MYLIVTRPSLRPVVTAWLCPDVVEVVVVVVVEAQVFVMHNLHAIGNGCICPIAA